MDSTITILAVALIIIFILLGREITCWYFKINQMIDLLQEISDKLDVRRFPGDLIEK